MLNDMYNKKEKEYGISQFPKKVSVAMAYIPYQQYPEQIYSPEKGLSRGTIFPVLDKPFTAAGGE